DRSEDDTYERRASAIETYHLRSRDEFAEGATAEPFRQHVDDQERERNRSNDGDHRRRARVERLQEHDADDSEQGPVDRGIGEAPFETRGQGGFRIEVGIVWILRGGGERVDVLTHVS